MQSSCFPWHVLGTLTRFDFASFEIDICKNTVAGVRLRGQAERDQNIQRGETELKDDATERLADGGHVSAREVERTRTKKTKWKGQDTGVKQRGAREVRDGLEQNRQPGSRARVLVLVCVKAHL